jgi:hypothetical protein
MPITNARPLELGLDTFGDVTADAAGRPLAHAQVIRDVVAEAELADEVGLDFFGVGEHHRADFAVSAPEVVLAAAPGGRAASASARPSRCSAPTTRCASTSASPRSTGSRAGAPR